MIGTLVGLLITLVIMGLVWWAGQRILALIPLAEPFATLVNIVLVLIVAFIAIYFFIQILGLAGIGVHLPVFR